MGISQSFSSLLTHHMQARMIGDHRLAQLANHKFGHIRRISRSTIRNWKNGVTKQVQDWRQLAAIANVLLLRESEVKSLFEAARLPKLTQLWIQASQEERDLLNRWMAKSTDKTIEFRLSRLEATLNNPIIPWQLPPRPDYFIGREEELIKLENAIHSGRAITLCGIAGIGKTALATELLYRLDKRLELTYRFPDGVLFHNFYREPNVDTALEGFVLAFGDEPRPTPQLAAQRVLSDKQVLLFLDGVEQVSNLRKILDVRGQCGLLLTSRRRQDAVAGWQDVQTLSKNQSITLFETWCSKAYTIHEDKHAIEKICEILGGHPLAIRIAGRYLAQTSETPQEYLSWLIKSPIEALRQGSNQQEDLSILLGRSLSRLSNMSRDSLAIMGQLAFAPFQLALFEYSLAKKSRQLKNAFNELVNWGVLTHYEDPNALYELNHQLIHSYLAYNILPSGNHFQKMVDYYTIFLENIKPLEQKAYSHLKKEQTHILRLLDLNKAKGDWDNLIKLATNLTDFLRMQGDLLDFVPILEDVIDATKRNGLHYEQGRYELELARVFTRLGMAEQALSAANRSLNLMQQSKNQHEIANCLGVLGSINLRVGNLQIAKGLYEESLQIARQIGNHKIVGDRLSNLTLIHNSLGNLELAVLSTKEALLLARKSNDQTGEANRLANLSQLYQILGKYDEASKFAEKGLFLSRKIGYKDGEISSILCIGRVNHAHQKYTEAITYFEEALDIAYHQNALSRIVDCLGALGSTFYMLNDFTKAGECFEGAYKQAKLHNEPLMMTRQLGNLGAIHCELGHLDKALDAFTNALKTAQSHGYKPVEANQLANIGKVYKLKNMVEMATKYWTQALTLYEELNSPKVALIRGWMSGEIPLETRS